MRNDGLQMPLFFYIGSPNRRSGLNLQIEPDILERHISVNMKSSDMYVMYVDGKLVVSNKALARVISEFIRVEKVTEISKLLIGIEKEICFPEKSRLSSDVVDALVQLGWLEAAHDILDDLESAGVSLELNVYKLLVRTYSKEHKFKEAKAKMIQDALKAFQKFQLRKLHPTVQTFSFLVDGYSFLLSCAYQMAVVQLYTLLETETQLSQQRTRWDCFLFQSTGFDYSLDLLTDWFYDSCLSFSSLYHPKFKAFLQQIGLPQLSKAYLGCEKLDAKYLDAKIVFENKLRDAMFFQLSIEGWKKEVSINYQGPTNTYLNVAFNLPNGSSLFHKVLVIESRKSPADYMRELLWSVITEISVESVPHCVGIISDIGNCNSQVLRGLESQKHWMVNLTCQSNAFFKLQKDLVQCHLES
ncbi:hypothetical protein H6P81_016403 [Aristolochia fimbriata]|uniref:DUF659 domain-containing protein n=1 Tax=Aristolochia fimbriata TaxID=158543 RepID=A0AAV7E8M6_ARIFI|nr:hypothetical protein H6P81_016403 [Aristolochia fimbriata]